MSATGFAVMAHRSGARSLRAAALLLVAASHGASCTRAKAPRPVRAPEVSAELARWAPPPREIAYDRKRVVGDIGLPMEPIRQRWSRAVVIGRALQFDITTGPPHPEPGRVVQRVRYSEDGLELLAEGPLRDGTPYWEPWVPPLVLLPAEPAVGATWKAEHQLAQDRVVRSCEIMTSDQCAAGLVVVCDREQSDFRLVTRDHYCPSEGWAGYESLLVRELQPAVRTWTEDLRRTL